jgi:CubicO group peptidase (beta-lactamase class C family)
MYQRWIRVGAARRARWLAPGAAAVALMALAAAGPAGAQVPERPLGRPATPVEAPAAVPRDTLLDAGMAPGAEAWIHPIPAWAAGAVFGLERQLAADVAEDGVGSMAAAVVVADRVVWSAAFGLADRDAHTLASPETVYRTGSISKPITALVLLALADRGVIGLDDPVDPYLPELRHLGNRAPDHPPIRFRDLAAHTAGLAREPAASHAGRGPIREWRRKALTAVATTEAVDRPGRAYRYSNIGYALLGLALERAAGRPFETLVQELVFDPLGMTSSYFVVPAPERRRVATGYVNPSPDSIDPRVPRAEHLGRGYRVPGEGVYSTTGDLARFAMAMTGALGDSLVSPAARAAALTDAMGGMRGAGVVPGSLDRGAAPTGYGIGFQLQRVGDTVIAGHSGTTAGYTAYLALDPRTRVAVILLRNYNSGATNLGGTAVRTLLDLAERAPGNPPPR